MEQASIGPYTSILFYCMFYCLVDEKMSETKGKVHKAFFIIYVCAVFLVSKHELKIVLSISAQTGEQELFHFLK